MEDHRHLPDPNRLSVLAAMVLLAYALIPFIRFPAQDLGVQLPGFFFSVQLNFSTIVSILVALIAAAGSDWLLHQHPHREVKSGGLHWLLPAMTAWVIGVPLTNLKMGVQWWAVFALGGVLLVLVLVSEYIVLDPSDVRHGPASVGLTAVSFALYLVLAIAVQAAGLRLYSLLPALVLAMFLVSLRALYLRQSKSWPWFWALGIAFVVGQLVIGLHYWPVSPVRFSLLLLGLGYSLTSLAGGLRDGRPWKTAWIEPLVMLVIIWFLAWVIGG